MLRGTCNKVVPILVPATLNPKSLSLMVELEGSGCNVQDVEFRIEGFEFPKP